MDTLYLILLVVERYRELWHLPLVVLAPAPLLLVLVLIPLPVLALLLTLQMLLLPLLVALRPLLEVLVQVYWIGLRTTHKQP